MFGNMKEMLKQAQNMKSQMKKIKKELESIEVEGVSANGACKVIMTADMKTQNVEIDETLLSSEAYVIENAIKYKIQKITDRYHPSLIASCTLYLVASIHLQLLC